MPQAAEGVRGPPLVVAQLTPVLLVAACAYVARQLSGTGAERAREPAVRRAG